jgi:hypothetical protein
MKASSIDDMKTICIGIKGRVLGLHREQQAAAAG